MACRLCKAAKPRELVNAASEACSKRVSGPALRSCALGIAPPMSQRLDDFCRRRRAVTDLLCHTTHPSTLILLAEPLDAVQHGSLTQIPAVWGTNCRRKTLTDFHGPTKTTQIYTNLSMEVEVKEADLACFTAHRLTRKAARFPWQALDVSSAAVIGMAGLAALNVSIKARFSAPGSGRLWPLPLRRERYR